MLCKFFCVRAGRDTASKCVGIAEKKGEEEEEEEDEVAI
jgi:hypothetical protein